MTDTSVRNGHQRACGIVGWCGILLASTLPGIISAALSGSGDPLWRPGSAWLQVSGLLGLLAMAQARAGLWPMRRPLAMLLAFLVSWRLLTPWRYECEFWSTWRASLSVGMSLAVSRSQWVLPVLCMSVCLIGSGLSRTDVFLTTGQWQGPVKRDWVMPIRGITWPMLFFIYLVLSYTISPAVWAWEHQPDFSMLSQVAPHSPGILIGSILNAIFEELIFRMLLLAVLLPAVGAPHAIAMTGVLFGLEHCGTGGAVGIALSSYTGWLYAKSMIETGGCRWALLQHMLGDIPVYVIVALSQLSP